VSIYNPEELDTLVDKFQVDIVQAPFNILDRRLQTTGWLSRLYEEKVEVHVRSIFLQGLLLMDQGMRPQMFTRWQPLWDQWDNWLREESLTPLEACLGFALSHPEVDTGCLWS
jgi:Aldo/keto reductase family.